MKLIDVVSRLVPTEFLQFPVDFAGPNRASERDTALAIRAWWGAFCNPLLMAISSVMKFLTMPKSYIDNRVPKDSTSAIFSWSFV